MAIEIKGNSKLEGLGWSLVGGGGHTSILRLLPQPAHYRAISIQSCTDWTSVVKFKVIGQSKVHLERGQGELHLENAANRYLTKSRINPV